MTSQVVLIAGNNAKQIGSIGQVGSLSVEGSLSIGNIGSLVGNIIHASPSILPPTPRSTPVLLYPRAFPSLIGRQEEVKQALEALPYDLSVSLYGTSGIGKTAFLRYLVHHPAIARFSGGIIYHRLVRRQSASDLLQVFFNAFYECQQPFKGTDIQIREALKDKKALIILDGATLTREDVDRLMNDLPSCTFLFASLERQLWGEGRVVELRGLTTSEAVTLVSQELGRNLSSAELSEAEALCVALEGHPLRILQAVALMREEKKSLTEIVRQYQFAAPAVLTQQLLTQLPQSQRVILFLLAALGAEIALEVEQIADITELTDVKPEIESLLRRQLIQAEGDRYRLASNQIEPIRQQTSLTGWTQRLITYFRRWVERNQSNPERLLQESDAIFQVLSWAVQAEQWSDVLCLGRAIEGSLALSGQWDSWNTVLQWMLNGARITGDQAIEAFVLHQLGTRSLCLQDTAIAHTHLTQALEIRKSINDQPGLKATRLTVNLTSAPPSEVPPERPLHSVTRSAPPSWIWKGLLLVFLAMGGGLVSQVIRSTPPSSVPSGTQSSTPPSSTPSEAQSSTPPSSTPSEAQSSTPPSSVSFGTAPKSWCIGMLQQWNYRMKYFNKNDESIKAAMEERNCSYWKISIPSSTAPSTRTP